MGETTHQPTRYDVPNTLLTLWDLPGWGTVKNPLDTYFMDKKLYAFDVVFIVYAGRPSQGVPVVVRGCAEFRVQYTVARNKADIDIAFLLRASMSYEDAVARLREVMNEEMAQYGLGALFTHKFLIRCAWRSAIVSEEGGGGLCVCVVSYVHVCLFVCVTVRVCGPVCVCVWGEGVTCGQWILCGLFGAGWFASMGALYSISCECPAAARC